MSVLYNNVWLYSESTAARAWLHEAWCFLPAPGKLDALRWLALRTSATLLALLSQLCLVARALLVSVSPITLCALHLLHYPMVSCVTTWPLSWQDMYQAALRVHRCMAMRAYTAGHMEGRLSHIACFQDTQHITHLQGISYCLQTSLLDGTKQLISSQALHQSHACQATLHTWKIWPSSSL